MTPQQQQAVDALLRIANWLLNHATRAHSAYTGPVRTVPEPAGPITVTWGPHDESLPEIGTCGGWFRYGIPVVPTWQEYLDEIFDPCYWPWLEALRQDVVENRRLITSMGDSDIVPTLSDGTVRLSAWFSNRGWGDFMAAMWNTHNADNRFTYLDFAWELVREPK